MIQNDTVAAATKQMAAKLLHAEERGSRAGRVRELPTPELVTVRDPRRNLAVLPERRLNPWVTLAEFPWLLAGRNDISWLEPYLPRAADFSDDGRTWRAGYGPRMRAWDGDRTRGGPPMAVDQLAEVVDLLTRSPDSRRAVVSIWDPAADWVDSRDIPCTNWLHFYIRDGRLDLTVAMRSNDLVWGMSGVNMTNFTTLQQIVAGCIGARVGYYHHIASSLHVYERHWHMLEGMAGATSPYAYSLRRRSFEWTRPAEQVSLEGATAAARRALEWVEEDRRAAPGPAGWMPLAIAQAADLGGPWLPFARWAYFMSLHRMLEHGDEAGILRGLAAVHRSDWGLAAAAAIVRSRRHLSRQSRMALAVSLGAEFIRSTRQVHSWATAVLRPAATVGGAV